MNDIWFQPNITLYGVDIIVLDDDLHDFISEYADVNTLELDELYDLLDDWIFEGVN